MTSFMLLTQWPFLTAVALSFLEKYFSFILTKESRSLREKHFQESCNFSNEISQHRTCFHLILFHPFHTEVALTRGQAWTCQLRITWLLSTFFNPKVIFASEAPTLSLWLGPLTPLKPQSPGKLNDENTRPHKCLFSSVLSSKQCLGEKKNYWRFCENASTASSEFNSILSSTNCPVSETQLRLCYLTNSSSPNLHATLWLLHRRKKALKWIKHRHEHTLKSFNRNKLWNDQVWLLNPQWELQTAVFHVMMH